MFGSKALAVTLCVTAMSMLSVAGAQMPAGITAEGDGSVFTGRARAFEGVSMLVGPQTIVRLQGIEPFNPGSSCTLPHGFSGCDVAIMQEINRVTRGIPVRCRWGEDEMDGRGLPVDCAAGQTNIAAHLVSSGVAAATDARYEDEQKLARASSRGYWANNR